MKTLTMKRKPHDTLFDYKPSIPAFMEASGTCAILVRDARQHRFSERWIRTSGYITEAVEANDIEVERYAYNHNPDELTIMDDLPEPFDCLDAEAWASCIEPDLDDYEYITNQYEKATRLVA